MNHEQWSATKWFVAIFVGVPVTLLGIGYVAVGGLFGAMLLMDEPRAPMMTLLITLWLAAGIAGLIGFWMWVLQPPGAAWRRRVGTAVLILTGIAAMAPMILWENVLIAWVGIGTGMFAIASLLANYPLERSVDHHG